MNQPPPVLRRIARLSFCRDADGFATLGPVRAAVAWLGYKKFVSEAERVSARVRAAEKEQQTGAQGTLIEDPDTGEYRLKKPEE